MTKELARNILTEHIRLMGDEPSLNEDKEALSMAIKALSQEPCTDAVSRDAVIYYIKGHIHEIITESGTDKNAHTNSILRALINGVETMPSVTQKSGKWIELPKALNLNENPCKCSECGHILSFMNYYPKSNFCPNCGARMVEPQESEVV